MNNLKVAYSNNLGTLSMWKNNPVTVDPVNENYLKNTLGVSVKLMQDENKILAIADPVKFIQNRSKLIQSWFLPDGAVQAYFDNIYEDYLRLGYPADVAKSFARDEANEMYEKKLKLLEIQLPDGFHDAFAKAGIAHDNMIESAKLAGKLEYKASKQHTKI